MAWTPRPCCDSSSTSAVGRGVYSSSPASQRWSRMSASDCLRRSAPCSSERPMWSSRPWRESAVHELSVATAGLNTALKHADGRPVALVSVRSGALRQVVPSSLEFYFEIVARDTPCERARLELVEIAARLRCSECGHQWELGLPAFRCPGCGTGKVEVVA